MFQLKRKTKTEYVVPQFYKDWAHADAELESLGRRLDAVRGVLKDIEQRGEQKSWAYRHWTEVESIVLRKWRHTLRLKEVGLRQTGTTYEGPEINYDWWEDDDGMGSIIAWPLCLSWMNRWFNHSDLDASWEKAKEQKLQKARQGLA